MSKYELIEMQHVYKKNPSDAQLGLELVKLLLQDNNYADATALIQSLTCHSIIEEETIMQLLKQFDGKVDHRNLIQLYEQVLEDCYCNISIKFEDVNLARQLTQTVTNLYGSIPRKLAMITYERIITQFCFDYENGSKFFKSFRKFEQRSLIKSEENNQQQQKEAKAIENSIRSIFHRQLKIVSKDIDLIWDEYNQWEKLPEQISKVEDIYKQTSQNTLNQEAFEKLFRSVTSFTEKDQVSPLEILQGLYQQYEKKEIDIPKFINFYEIGLHQLQVYGAEQEMFEEAWLYFRGFLQEHTNAQIQLKYFRRASKAISPSISLFQLILRCLEQAGKDEEYLESEYGRLVLMLESSTEIYQMMKAKVCYYTRKFLMSEDKERITVSIRSQFEKIIKVCDELGEEKESQICDTYQNYAKVEALLFDSIPNSQKIMEQCVKKFADHSKNWSVFLSLFNVKAFTSQSRDKYRGIIKRASEFVKDDREIIVTQWIEFETLFGSVEELTKAESKMIQIYKANMEEEQNGDVASEIEEESEIPVIKKQRRAKPIQEEESEKKDNKRKRNKKEEVQDVVEKKIKENVEEHKIFIDNEKTIFVRNIPTTLSEEDLVKLIVNKDQVLECRFVMTKNKEFKGFAYIDFMNANEAEIGAKQLNQKLVGQNKLYAAVSKPPRTTKDDELTLFFNNLPFTVNEDKIKSKLKENASIKVLEVRIIKDEEGKAKGYAYVEFADQESVIQAQNLMLDSPMIEGRKCYVERADSLSIIKKKQKLQVILVKNLSFKAKEKHIQELFQDMDLSQILIPRDDHNKPKGFAFVEFTYLKQFQQALEMVDAKVLGRAVQILKSDREITQNLPKGLPKDTDPEEYKKPKSNQDFKKFL